MVQKIWVKNFKSINELTIDLSRVTIIVGENGGGKSNILESVAFATTMLFSRNSSERLPKETLNAKGVRVGEDDDLFSHFTIDNKGAAEFEFSLANLEFLKFQVTRDFVCDFKKYERNGETVYDEVTFRRIMDQAHQNLDTAKELAQKRKDGQGKGDESETILNILADFSKLLDSVKKITEDIAAITKDPSVKFLDNFCIYSPENSFLRKFEDESQVAPIGVKGDGLFKELKNIYFNKKDVADDIIRNLQALEWFETFIISESSFPGEAKILIKDKYLDSDTFFLDQRNANEGFLFLLFYLTLFASENTPKFFAIDNIEASFNPKLCTRLIKILCAAAKKYDKQVIITTHNPFILDGLDLQNDDQSLLVVRRNFEGHTVCNPIVIKETLDVKLSEAWMRGYIGGLPKNF